MSSHREAPETAKDPVADSTDVYAFVSPDNPETVTLISNYVPFESPAGGPNFYEFGDDVLYEIHIANSGTNVSDITYQFRFTTTIRNPNTFLYNTGPILAIDSTSWNRPQTYSVTRIDSKGTTSLGTGLTSPPCHIGPRSTPNYEALAQAAVHTLPSGETVFAGQRRDGFYVDLGAVFDLLDLRPFSHLHLIPGADESGVDTLLNSNVHTIAIQVPKKMLTSNGNAPSSPTDSTAVIGVWASASRQTATMRDKDKGTKTGTGPFVQVSRLGNPLFNEVLVPMAKKDMWNSQPPTSDSAFVANVDHPEVAALLPILYPGVFPNLAAYTKPRADLNAILLSGIPAGVVPGFQNFRGPAPADMLRLNMAIPPAATQNVLGILGGDLAGFPNGRRVADDVTTIELRAIAGVTLPLVDPTFTPDGAAAAVTDIPTGPTFPRADRYIANFPYLGVPKGGFESPSALTPDDPISVNLANPQNPFHKHPFQ